MDSRGSDEQRRRIPRGERPRGDFRSPPSSRDRGKAGEPGEFARDSQGRPIVDRFGRPVRNRPRPGGVPGSTPRPSATGSGGGSGGTPPRRRPPRRREAAQPTRFEAPQAEPQRPRQYIPTHQPPHQQPPQPSQQPLHQQQATPPRRRPPRKRRGLRLPRSGCLTPFIGILVVILVLVGATTLWADSKLTRVEATPENQVSNTAGTNWLLVGSDSRAGLSEEETLELGTGGDIGVGRTDTIMLLHIPTTGSARLVSLPRDSYVEIPGYGMNKINAAFTFGGPQLLAETVELSTGLRVDHYAEIGMGGLARIVDSIGGIEMCVDEAIQDPLANLDIQAGCQEFDGAAALGYVRTRATALGDLDRVERQREFFAALLDKVTSAGTIANPFRLIPLVSDTASTFTVGDNDHVWHLARVALAMRSGVGTETVPFAGFADYDVGNVVLWDPAGAEALWSSMR
ncbi:Regulatory protein MsrR [Corynebacterium occultum]|uniref:Regulatory protein MsrR n=1 Tax=Corynebacterium occultum TaxID=2675219 RepID=A0A6B8W7D4_9CORY|nr:LCP family protein [Corynebacterium occultum]QGU08561.1 Regulatory protein MsrR [Corynebacterium occultum]